MDFEYSDRSKALLAGGHGGCLVRPMIRLRVSNPRRQQPPEREGAMSTHEKAQEAALDALVSVLGDSTTKVELRIEAAKVILNRPRFFVDSDHPEK